MSEFKIGPEYLNEALDAAGITGLRMTKTAEGQLHLDSGELTYDEILDKLISGLALLYARCPEVT
jgi:hypothetical protein